MYRIYLALTKFQMKNVAFEKLEPADFTPEDLSTYDYIVVGAGSSGAVVASGLSEISSWSVLIIEAGDTESLNMTVPLATEFFQLNESVNWMYEAEPSNNYCLGMEEQKCKIPAGKVMGGSSVLTSATTVRGHPRIYDIWANMGNAGWSYRDVLPYFKKSENMRISKLARNRRLHGTRGPMHISYSPYHTNIGKAFLKAGVGRRYSLVDYDSEDMIGFANYRFNMKSGERMSTNTAYLRSIRYRRNLHVSKNSVATRILIDNQTKRAYGVEFVKDNKTYTVIANKEVIISAGAIGTPKLLMLSGIGHAEHLKDLEIEIVQNLPVGDNLMDHVGYCGLTFMANQPVTLIESDLRDYSKPYLLEYLEKRKGPLTLASGREAVGFLNFKRGDEIPSIELMFTPKSLASIPSLTKSLGLTNDVWIDMFEDIANKHSWSVTPILARPQSRGTVRLNSNDTNANPSIVPNYFSNPEDVKTLIQGIREVIKISETKHMRKYGSKLHHAIVTGCESFKYDSDDYWECAMKTITCSAHRYSGTCKMGPENDPTAVVNSKLQVIGVSGLRVVDASIMPTIPTSDLLLPNIMIAEKAADMIKQFWGRPIAALED